MIPFICLDAIRTFHNALCHRLEHDSILMILGCREAACLVIILYLFIQRIESCGNILIRPGTRVRTLDNTLCKVRIGSQRIAQFCWVNHSFQECLVSIEQGLIGFGGDIFVCQSSILAVNPVECLGHFAKSNKL